MHRLAAVPGLPDDAGTDGSMPYVEQPPAPIVILSSADTDLLTLASLLERPPNWLEVPVRALNLSALTHPAVIDHYLATSLSKTQVVLVRLLGGRGHWPYGLEQLQRWSGLQQPGPPRQLLVLSGTAELDGELSHLGTVSPDLALAVAACLRSGGPDNFEQVLQVLVGLQQQAEVAAPVPQLAPDPLPHDWRNDAGSRVGVILYRASYQAGDTALVEAINASLRRRGLCPRALWVSGLRDPAAAQGVADLLVRERVEAVLCGTGFASVSFEEAGMGAPLWERIGVPVLQLLCSGRPRRHWQDNPIGLGPLDLSLQVALPELDGRITTRVGAFKEPLDVAGQSTGLATALMRLQPDAGRLDWIVELTAAWIALRTTPPAQRRVALVLANYPTRNSRLANGVGLDTPASAAAMLHWLQQQGYDLGAGPLPDDGDALIQQLLAGRSNDPESGHRPPLDHLPPDDYQHWYAELPLEGRQRLEAVWGLPAEDAGLEKPAGFPVRGLRFGNVVVLIQPERGYDRDPLLSYHSPDLPPTHAYLAQYLWLRQTFAAQVVVHVGKHGNLEWLPGKGVGLSEQCFPEWALGPLPHLYPFIVNDPGEGSQAKRRAQAVILDHLTPPLGRAGLHGDLLALEGLLDEYWEACSLGGERAAELKRRLAAELDRLELLPHSQAGDPDRRTSQAGAVASDSLLDARLDAVDGYLCEIKEAQIRIGLHRYGLLPDAQPLAELLLCLARPPQAGYIGLTQALAADLGLRLDPWSDSEEAPLAESDRQILASLPQEIAGPPTRTESGPTTFSDIRTNLAVEVQASQVNDGSLGRPVPEPETLSLRCCGDGTARLEAWALTLMQQQLSAAGVLPPNSQQRSDPTCWPAYGPATAAALERIRGRLLPDLLACGNAEKDAFLRGLEGGRIAAGPSGAPTRGRPDLLPTGRNFYSVDLRGLPTEAAWDLGRRSAELLLDLHRLEQGEELRTLALSVWGTATMRNGGEDIAQALALMGVRPVWDGPTRRMVDLEVIPLPLLGRPRVDVTLRISGLFRDAFPQLVGWVNRASRLVAALREEGEANPLAMAALAEGSSARVFGSAPGAYGAGLQGLIDSGQWEERSDLAEAYLNWSSWRYDGERLSPGGDQSEGLRINADRSGFEQRLAQVQVVLHNQDNREHDLLDSDDYYQFQGGLSAAVERLSGSAPALWFGDHSRPQRPRLHRLEKEFDKVLRSRLLNPRWIEAMQQHGYKGGFEMAASLDYLFAYDASTGRVPDWSYGALSRSWLGDADVLSFLRRHNPWALRDMAERLLEAAERGLWQGADSPTLTGLRQLVLDSEALVEG